MSAFIEECWFQAAEWANARAAEHNYSTREGAQLEIDEGAKLGKLFEELEALRAQQPLVQEVIRLESRRCGDCGRWYAYEGPSFVQCPVCLEKRRWTLFEETQRLGRVISALRGAITRTKRLTRGK